MKTSKAWRLRWRCSALFAGSIVLAACGGSSHDGARDPVVTVASGVPLLTSPRITGAADGAVWIAWVEQASNTARAVSARVDRNGSVQRTPLSGAVAVAAAPVQLTTAGSTPLAAWFEELGSDVQWVVAAWDGQRWVQEQSIAQVYGEAHWAVGPNGQLALAWTEFLDPVGSRLRVAVRDAAGTWAAPQDVRTISFTLPLSAQLAFDTAGTLFAAWQEYLNNASSTSDPDFALWYSMLPSGSAWTAPVLIEPEKVGVVRVVSTAAASWLIAWNAGGPLEPRRLYSRMLTQGAWDNASQRIDSLATESPRELSVQGGNGAVQAAWSALSDTNVVNSVRVARRNVNNGQWLASTLLLQSTVVQPVGLRLQQQADGRAAMIWNYSSGDHLPWVAISSIAGAWETATHLDDEAFDSQGADLTTVQDGWAAAWYRRRGAVFDIAMRRLR